MNEQENFKNGESSTNHDYKNILGHSWDFFDKNGVKYFSSNNIQIIKQKLLCNEIKTNDLCTRNGIGDRKSVSELMPKYEKKIAKLFNPFVNYRNISLSIGSILGLLSCILLILIFPGNNAIDFNKFFIGIFLSVFGFIGGIFFEKIFPNPLFIIGAIILVIIGIIHIIIGIGVLFLIIVFFSLIGLSIGFIIYRIRKPEKIILNKNL